MSAIKKIIEIAKREHADITEEHMKDILSIADKAAAELAQLRAEREELREVLEMAKNGLEWWKQEYPLAVEECDYDALKEICTVLEKYGETK